MKTAVVTIASGKKYEELGKLTHPTILKYAMRIGAEFIVWRDTKNHDIPAYKKLELGSLLETFDRVLYIDTDIIVRDDAPNIFELVPEDQIGLFEEGKFQDRKQAMMALVHDSKWMAKNAYYNTGVMVVSKIHKDMFRQPTIEVDNFMEQTYLNYMIFKSGHKVFSLPHRFNRMLWLDGCGEQKLDSYFLHYAGAMINNIPIKDIIKKDLEDWKKAKPDFKFPRKIHFTIRGGFGDQVSSEPAVRYAKETIFKNDYVVIHTDHPEVFQHLDVKIHKFGDGINDAGFYKIDLTPIVDGGPLNINLMHQVDYASIRTFGGIMPAEKKYSGIKDFKEEGIARKISKKHVLIHASQWWPTKTFPREFWRMVAEEAVACDLIPTFIGKTAEEGPSVMTVPVDGSMDLVNMMSVKELIGSIQACGFLVTTDSAPLHLAGSSGCKIGLVAPIRAPWTIMPFRPTGMEAQVLCQGEPWMIPNFSPNQVEEVRLDNEAYVPALYKCLPSREMMREFFKARG